jgi:hypothetical protein
MSDNDQSDIPAGPWNIGLTVSFINVSGQSIHSTRSLLRFFVIILPHSIVLALIIPATRRSPLDRLDRSRPLLSGSRRNHRIEMSIIFLTRLALRLLSAKWRQSKGGLFRKCRYERGFYWTAVRGNSISCLLLSYLSLSLVSRRLALCLILIVHPSLHSCRQTAAR